MSNYEIIEERPVSQLEALKSIKAQEKETELTYREEKIKDFLKNKVPLKQKEYEEAKKALEDLNIPRLEEAHIIKIIDLMPRNGTELRAIVAHSGTVLVDENAKKILDVLKKYS